MLEPRASSRKQDSRATVYTSPSFQAVRAAFTVPESTPSWRAEARACWDCQPSAPWSSFMVTTTPSAPASWASWAALPSSSEDRETERMEEASAWGSSGGVVSPSWEESGRAAGSPSITVTLPGSGVWGSDCWEKGQWMRSPSSV